MSFIFPINCGSQHALHAQSPDAADDTLVASSLRIKIASVGRAWVLLARAGPAAGMKQPKECSQRKAAFPWRRFDRKRAPPRRDDEAFTCGRRRRQRRRWRSAGDPRHSVPQVRGCVRGRGQATRREHDLRLRRRTRDVAEKARLTTRSISPQSTTRTSSTSAH